MYWFRRMNLWLIMLLLSVLTLVPATWGQAAAREKVLLDTDTTELFDDGVAMLMLAKSPDVDLLGVTVVTGNMWTAEGVAAAVRQLEGINRADIPVAVGVTPASTKERFRNIETERKLFGIGNETYIGAAGYEEPTDWEAVYREKYKEAPAMRPVSEPAADFIIRTIKENPGEVTIAAIGPCTNLAAALTKSPEIASLAKRIVYMGGAFFGQGNTTPAAEFNFWADPAAAKRAVRAPFAEQIFLPLEAAEKMPVYQNEYRDLLRRIKSQRFKDVADRCYVTRYFAEGEKQAYIYDVLAAAVIIDPTVVKSQEFMAVDVNDTWSLSYGQSLAFREAGPEGSQKAHIVTDIDRAKVLKMLQKLFDEL